MTVLELYNKIWKLIYYNNLEYKIQIGPISEDGLHMGYVVTKIICCDSEEWVLLGYGEGVDMTVVTLYAYLVKMLNRGAGNYNVCKDAPEEYRIYNTDELIVYDDKELVVIN